MREPPEMIKTVTVWDMNSHPHPHPSNTFGNGSVGAISTSSCRTGNCYRGQCSLTNTDYLVQPFPAVFGRIYTISFWYLRIRTGEFTSTATVYVGTM